MDFSMIVAMSHGGLIGGNGRIPWILKRDLRRFAELTKGNTIIMGRKTHESIGRRLEGRSNVILTRDRGYSSTGCMIAHNRKEAIEASIVQDVCGSCERFVIGGAEVYSLFFPLLTRAYVTLIDSSYEGDTFFNTREFYKLGWEIESHQVWPSRSFDEPDAVHLVMRRN